MSEYRDFVHDFASRCQEVLQAFLQPARSRDREVTLLLMAAAGGFVMSYERLRDDQGFPQPPIDRHRYAAAGQELARILEERIAASPLLQGQDSWRGGALVSAAGAPDGWPELRDPARFSADAPVSQVVRGLRHAVAHGNVLTRSSQGGQIAELVFVSGGIGNVPLRYVLVAPDDLARFLHKWFAALGDLPLAYQEVLRVVGEAA